MSRLEIVLPMKWEIVNFHSEIHLKFLALFLQLAITLVHLFVYSAQPYELKFKPSIHLSSVCKNNY